MLWVEIFLDFVFGYDFNYFKKNLSMERSLFLKIFKRVFFTIILILMTFLPTNFGFKIFINLVNIIYNFIIIPWNIYEINYP